MEAKTVQLNEEFITLVKQIERLVEENAHKAQDQDEYAKRFTALSERIQQKKAEITAAEEEKTNLLIRKENVRIYVEGQNTLASPLKKFDVVVWHKLVDYTKVMPDKTFVFRMRDGHDEVVRAEEAL